MKAWRGVLIALSFLLMRERTGRLGAFGILLALLALPTFDFAPGSGGGASAAWLVPALIVMLCWGVQAYFMKAANHVMSGESIFVYMMLSGLTLIPVAWAMTDFGRPINWGLDGPWLAALIQVLNAIGALTLVFAFRQCRQSVKPDPDVGASLLAKAVCHSAPVLTDPTPSRAGSLPQGSVRFIQ
jgi:hypothetical protein